VSGLKRNWAPVLLVILGLVLVAGPPLAGSVLAARPAAVIILTLDGTREDVYTRLLPQVPAAAALAAAGAAGRGARSLYARTPEGHAVILSGAAPEAFGFAVRPQGLTVETLFDVATKTGRRSLLFDGKGGRLRGLERSATIVSASKDYSTVTQPTGSQELLAAFWAEFDKTRPFLAACLIPAPDRMGHLYGHASSQYDKAITNSLSAVVWLVDQLKSRGLAGRTLIVVTADHAMTDYAHNGGQASDMLVPLLIAGPGIARGVTLVGATTADIAPTIAAISGLPRPRGATGRVLEEALDGRTKGARLADRARLPARVAGIACISLAVALWLTSGRSLRSGRS
jgi:hypothetical protein